MQSWILRFIYSGCMRWALKLFVGVKFQKPDFLLHEKQFIIIANHNSHMDTLVLLSSLPSRVIHKVKPVAAADYFGKTKFQEKLSNYFINTLLIFRAHGNAISKLKQALDDGYSLILFPEGSRGEPEKNKPTNRVWRCCYRNVLM